MVMFVLPATSAKLIAKSMEHCSLNEEAIDAVARWLSTKVTGGEFDIGKWKSDNPLHPQEMNAQSAQWIFVVDSLNFSFWPNAGEEFSVEGQVGYWALCAAMNRALREGVPITDANFCSKLTYEEACRVFRTDQSRTIPMLRERVQVLNQNGQILLEKFGGSIVNCIKQAGGSALTLLKLIYGHFPSFRDESLYKRQNVTFLKRAQIFVADLWGCFEGTNLGAFSDINQLTMFADYRIPQVLHYLDVLHYSPPLIERLKNNALLENGEQYEVEIRGASIHAVESIRHKMRQLTSAAQTTEINSIQIDFYLWGYRRDHSDKIDQKSPYHRVRSIFY